MYFFTKGFLLTRLVLEEKSSCTQLPITLEPVGSFVPGTYEVGCWHPKTFEKAVVVIVDALRYDFTVPFNGSSPSAFHNALPFLYDTAIQEPHNAFLLPFIADPPTTTLQRLKGLTTGTLPTFIDAGSNFAGTAIEEDNLLIQLRDAGRRIVHLGDDTWTALFPNYFEPELSRAYDSLNVWDLHTVDNGVTEHILPLLGKEKRGLWDVMFAHYLGVDHAGHRYGPNHPAMTAKLQQMNGVLQEIVAALDEDTLLVVMGDHGMDSKGDHGGESDDEVEAALWMYSKKGIFGRTTPDYVVPPQRAKERPVSQIDLVPTLSLLLGLPIPFNNLGKPIEEAFAGKTGVAWDNLAAVLRITTAALKRYQTAYYAARGLDESMAEGSPRDLWDKAESTLAGKRSNGDLRKRAYGLFSAYQQETLRICRALWARFDVPSMLQGIAILAASLLVLLIYARNVVDDDDAVRDPELDLAERKLELEAISKRITTGDDDVEDLTPSIVTGAFIGSAAGGSFGITVSLMSVDASTLNDSLLGVAIGGLLGVVIAQFGSSKHFRSPLPSTTWSWLAAIFTISQSIGFASNSYTIWEDSILLFYLSTFGILTAIASFRQSTLACRTLGIYHSLLFVLLGWTASFSRLCREEQMPYCRSTYYASATSSTSAPWQLLIPFMVAALLPSIIKSYYVATRSYEGFAPVWINVALRSGLLAAAIFWLLDAADDGEWFPSIPKGTLKSIRIVIAQTIFALSLAAGTTAFGWATPCVSISTTTFALGSGKAARVTILGYANAHGTHYLLLFLSLLLSALLVQKPMGSGALSLMTMQILTLLEILDSSAPRIKDSPIGPIILAMLGSYHFFKTGHQAALSSIQWESAFIPLHTIRYPWSPLLVVLNTFGSHILAAIAVPLTVLWKSDNPKARPKELVAKVARAWAWFLVYFTVEALATTMWAGWLRRHLMLYRIFSPRFMVGAAVLLIVECVGLGVVWMGSRTTALSIGEMFGWA
jgi:GPI ethanolamine phosphate transferase 3 subunit O